MNKVLMIAYVFPPMGGSGVQRTLKFIKYLPHFGWLPAVVTIKPYGGHVMDSTLASEVPPEVDVARCYSLELRRAPQSLQPFLGSAPVARLRHAFQVPDHCIGWLPFALSAAGQSMREGRADVLYSSSPPGTAHLIGDLLKRQYSRRRALGANPWLANEGCECTETKESDLG